MELIKDIHERPSSEKDSLDFSQSPAGSPSKWRKLYLYVKAIKPLFLTHHPLCKEFDGHTIKLGKKRACLGCVYGYSSTAITMLLILALNLPRHFNSVLFFIIAVLFMAFFLLSPLGLTQNKKIKVLQKIIIGTGTGCLFTWILLLPNLLVINVFLLFMVLGMGSTVLNAYHAFGIYQTCKKCKYEGDWDTCPGFQRLHENLKTYNLPNIFHFKSKRKHGIT